MSQSPADLYHTRAALVEIAQQGDVRLARGDYLVDVSENSTEPVKRCQDVPAEAFMRHEQLLYEATIIVAVSYCWCNPEHPESPDPDRYHTPVIAKMVSAILAGRLASTPAMGELAGFNDCDGRLVQGSARLSQELRAKVRIMDSVKLDVNFGFTACHQVDLDRLARESCQLGTLPSPALPLQNKWKSDMWFHAGRQEHFQACGI
eukprot:5661066-Amphidinium_carterae.2